MKKCTRLFLRCSGLYNALIAILTSAIVTMLANGGLHIEGAKPYLLCAVFFSIVSIVLLSRVSAMSQSVRNREMLLVVENGYKGDALLSAFLDTLHLMPGGKTDKGKENVFIAEVSTALVLICCIVFFSLKGESCREAYNNQALVSDINYAAHSIEDKVTILTLRLEDHMDSLSVDNQELSDFVKKQLIEINKSIKAISKSQP